MKFLADMGISPKTVAFLHSHGFEADHLHALGLQKLPDKKILEIALSERRIIPTHDLDFGDLLAASGAKLPSVIIFRLKRMTPSHVNAYLMPILDSYRDALERGGILTVTEGRVRVRYLPVFDTDTD